MSKKVKEICVAVRLSASQQYYKPGRRYIQWIDDKWYETTDVPTFLIPENEIEKVKRQLDKHYQYHAAFMYPDGHEEIWNTFRDKAPKASSVKFTMGNGISFVL